MDILERSIIDLESLLETLKIINQVYIDGNLNQINIDKLLSSHIYVLEDCINLLNETKHFKQQKQN